MFRPLRISPRTWFRIFLASILLASAGVQALSVGLGDSPQLIVSDGKCYYAWVRSALLDGDFQFRDDYEILYPPDPVPEEHDQLTPRGNAVNKYPLGLPLLELPGFLLGHLVALAAPPFPADGVSLPYQLAVAETLLALAIAGIVLLRKTMIAWGVGEGLATALVVPMVLGTNFIHYLAKEPAMPHAAGLALTCVVMYVAGRPSRHRDLWLGLLLGLLVLVRNSNVALLPFLGTMIVLRGPLTRRSWLIPAGMALVLSLQPLSLHALWGDFRLSTYPNEGFTAAPEGFAASLFSPRHGLFLYGPWYLVLLAVAVAGAVRRTGARAVAIGAIASFLCLLAINGSWWCWWFGASFGNRAYIEILPVLTATAGIVLSRGPLPRIVIRAGVPLGVAVCALNLYLWGGYLLQRYPQEDPIRLAEAYGWILR